MNKSNLEIAVLSVIVIILLFALLGFDRVRTDGAAYFDHGSEFVPENSGTTDATVIFLDNMNGANDTASLKSRGYKVYNRGTSPQGTAATWFQGNPAFFNAYEGPTTGYVACNFRVASSVSTIDSWLVTPRMTVFTGDTLSFYSRSKDNSTYPDSFRVMYSAVGDSVPEAVWTELGRFKVSTSGWVLKKFVAPATGGNARFAVRYRIANSGPGGTNGEYSGIDLLQVARGPGACQLTWSQKLVISDAGNKSDSLRFGISGSGTNLIDSCLGEYPLPPAPPSGAFDCRFVLPNNDGTTRDIRNDSAVNRTWRLTFQPSGSGYPILLNWNPPTLPALGSFTLKDEVNGTIVNINMRTQSSYSLGNSGITSLKIEYVLNSSLSVPVSTGWNMTSVPLFANDMNYNVLFPGIASQAYKYQNGYIPVQVLSNGAGYWMKFNVSGNYIIQGTPYQPEWINVTQGWNMIGPFTQNIPVSSILTNPPGIINSNFFGYEGGYVTEDTLKIGKGYWILTTGAGYLYKGTGDNPVISSEGEQFDKFAELSFATADGKTSYLYIANAGNQMTGMYSLPPVPPSGIFDARFSSDRIVETAGQNHCILLSGNNGETKLTISNLNGIAFRITDGINGKILDEDVVEGKEVRIPANVGSLVLKTVATAPVSYDLEQNYPNPFNPATTIKYKVPVDGTVNIAVYDILGREFKTLVNGYHSAGEYEIILNAEGMSSGVYFYRMTAGGFEAMKKFVVSK
ncbi:MAG: T9SS type A sorting domain-containing protein [Ignavibacteria bacterium]|nr:T9SS type A sorting domain-containing protein [Ignavibacteria bacterium]